MRNKNRELTTLFILLITIITGCGTVDKSSVKNEQTTNSNQAETIYPLTIKDSLKREIIIEKEPLTIISTGPNLTEVIYALGAEDKLIGRTSYCNYPEAVLSVEEISDTININIERIVELNPDLVLVTSFVHPDIIDNLESLNIKVLPIYKQENIQGALMLIADLGKVLNKSPQAEEVIKDMQSRIKKVKQRTTDIERPSVYYVAGFGEYGDYTATGDTYINELIENAGGNNVAKDGINWMYSYEKLIEHNPDIIILSSLHNTKESFISDDNYKELKAVKENQVYEINEDALTRQGPRIVDALEELQGIFQLQE